MDGYHDLALQLCRVSSAFEFMDDVSVDSLDEFFLCQTDCSHVSAQKLSVRLFSPVMMMMMKLAPPCTALLARCRLALNNLWVYNERSHRGVRGLRQWRNNELRSFVSLSASPGFGRKDVVDFLLQNGASVHARDDGGLISLHNACSFGHAEVHPRVPYPELESEDFSPETSEALQLCVGFFCA